MFPLKLYFVQHKMINSALNLAGCAHIDQKRKITEESYIIHTINVANIVFTATDNAYIISAALMHDTIEDSDITYEDIRADFCQDIADWVQGVTNVSAKADGNRKVRAKMELDHLRSCHIASKIIKLADIIDNCRSIPLLDPKFALIYMEEKKRQIGVLYDDDKRVRKLHNLATQINENYWKLINGI